MSDARPPLTRREAREREMRALAPTPAPARDVFSLTEFPIDTRPSPVARQAPVELPSRRAVRSGAVVAPRPRDRPGRARRTAARTLFSGLALLFAGAIAVGTSIPVNAFIPAGVISSDAVTDPAAPVAAGIPAQSLTVADGTSMPTTSRDSFLVMSYQQQLRMRYGIITGPTFTPTTGAIRWPFPYTVPISDGWGPRVAPCATCSSFHPGVDFTPGEGSPIYAVAAGVVSIHDDGNGGLGNNVMIDHDVDGLAFQSVYGHMLAGSSPLVVGQQVKAGDFIGLVGDTGSSVGAHLHFELHIDGVAVDPFAWLTAHAVN